MQHPGREKYVLFIARIDGRDAVLVNENLDRRAQPRIRELTIQEGHRPLRPIPGPRGPGRNQQDERQYHQSLQPSFEWSFHFD